MTFKPGQGGRMKGARNKISAAFLNDLLEEWSEGGREAMRIMRLERPSEFVKVVASVLPKELTVEVGPLQEISDDRLIEYIEYTERQLEQRTRSIEDRTESEANGEQARLLQAIPRSEILARSRHRASHRSRPCSKSRHHGFCVPIQEQALSH